MFKWLRRKPRKMQPPDECSVRITIEDTLAFTGTVESFDIHTDIKGSDAKVVISLKANDLLNRLRVGRVT